MPVPVLCLVWFGFLNGLTAVFSGLTAAAWVGGVITGGFLSAPHSAGFVNTYLYIPCVVFLNFTVYYFGTYEFCIKFIQNSLIFARTVKSSYASKHA